LVAKFGKVELAKGRNGYRKEARERERERVDGRNIRKWRMVIIH